ncbi:MAG: Gfo/Idh/MocA family oxidoreductase [Caldicoprobacterales bacterium]|jgi:UDP-N-acetyl-2-amino-2-deoxyglucuronate dehydrogenase|nr:Gfo/Idh/MocA family oxidoreductase [Clostridiales bacterium]
MESLGVAIIGCGAIHNVHVDAIKCNGMARLLWFVDIKQERAKLSAEKYGGNWCTDYRKVLEDPEVDVVHICTPHYLHAPMAIDAVNAGKHAFVEKPAATSLDMAKMMAEAAKKTNKKITICFQNRYNPSSIKAKEIIQSGDLGKIIGIKGLVTWYRDPEYYTSSGWRGSFDTEGGGVLINQSIHTLDLMQWLAGEVEYIQGHVATRVLGDVIEVEDTADATLYFKNGARGIFYATNCYTDNSPVEIEIHMEKGKLRIYDGKLEKIWDGKFEVLVDENSDTSPYKSYWGMSHGTLIREFYENLIKEKNKEIIPVEDGMISLQLLDGIYKSSSTGNIIKIN